jgi:MFS family permease
MTMLDTSLHKASTAAFSSRRAWYVVILLGTLYALSFIDRFILALLVQPLSAEFGLVDTQLGLLLGAGFAFVYSLAGLPLANLLDQGQRRKIVAGGAMVWSMATVASGFTHSFEMLAVCRAFVAIGEAVLSPAAISLIADMFPASKRSLPVSVYASVPSVMGIGAFIVGGAALDLATHIGPAVSTSAWRMTLVIVGVPGMALSVLFLLTVREPERVQAAGGENGTDLRAFFAYFRQTLGLFLPLFLGVGLGAIASYGLVSWTPTLLIRAYGIGAADAGYLFGAVVGSVALTAAFIWPSIARKISRPGTADGLMRCLVGATLLSLPFLIAAPFASNSVLLLVGLGLGNFMLACYAVIMSLSIQAYGQSRMRARLVATYLLFSNVLGATLGPLLVPVAAKLWPGDVHALGYGLALISGSVLPVVAFLFWLSLRAVKRMPLADAARVTG